MCFVRNILSSFWIRMLRVTGVLLGSCGHWCLPLLEEVSYQSLSQSHSQCPALGPQSPAGPLEPCLPARPAPALQLLSGAEPSQTTYNEANSVQTVTNPVWSTHCTWLTGLKMAKTYHILPNCKNLVTDSGNIYFTVGRRELVTCDVRSTCDLCDQSGVLFTTAEGEVKECFPV